MKHFLSFSGMKSSEVEGLLKLSADLKAKLKRGEAHRLLTGKTLAMLFEKPSNRTRISFEVGMAQLGGAAINVREDEIQMGAREPIADVSKVLSRYVDAVMIRAKAHSSIETFAEHSRVPVINGLSDLHHPCQALADALTIEEHRGGLAGKVLAYVGDGNNVCNSLIEIANRVNLKVIVACPKGYEPDAKIVGSEFEIERDAFKAVAEADAVYTDVWTSMGQEAETEKRLKDFQGYSVTQELLASGKKKPIFLHCLPAKRGEEVDEYVLDGAQSAVYDQAENRLHVQKAVLVHLLMGDVSTS